MKKHIVSKVFCLILSAVLAVSVFSLFVGAENTIGYKLIARKNGDYVTAEIYVKDGVALTGQVGIAYDNTKLTLVNYDKTAITTKDITSVVASMVTANVDTSVIILNETNTDDALIRDDSVYFAWFANMSAVVDATSTNVKIAEINFAVKSGATDLANALSFTTEAPAASTGIVGYKSGLFISDFTTGRNIMRYASKAPYLAHDTMYIDGVEFVVTGDTLVEYKGIGGNVEIPAGVANIETGVFDDNTTIVKLPTGVTQVASGAFKSGTKVYVSPKVNVTLIGSLKADGNAVTLYGDMNEDGAVDVNDFTLYLKNMSGSTETVTTDSIIVDIAYDGAKTLKDLWAFMKFFISGTDIGYQG